MSLQPLQFSAWRSGVNPLAGLTLPRLVTLLIQAEQGYYAEIQWVYRYIEKRDSTLMAVKSRRLAALRKLDWSVKVMEEFKTLGKDGKTIATPQAERQRAALAEVYEGIDNLKQAVGFLAGAAFRGFAHLEKHYRNNRPSEGIHHLEPVPQWYWARRNPNPQWYYNAAAQQTNRGKWIDNKHFVILEHDAAIDEIAAIAHVRKAMSKQDWDGYLRAFGIAPMFVELPLGTGAAGTPEYQELVDQIMSNSRGVLPNGARLATVPDGSRGGRPFKEHQDAQNEEIVLAATGGLLTALTQATGISGGGQSDNHRDAFDDIATGAAGDISEAFQAQIDNGFLDEKFPDEEHMVYFDLASEEIGDGDRAIEDAKGLKSAGYEIETAQLSDKTGYKLVNLREVAEQAAKEQQEAEAKAAKEQQAAAEKAAAANAEPVGDSYDWGDDATANRALALVTGLRAAVAGDDALLNRALDAVE